MREGATREGRFDAGATALAPGLRGVRGRPVLRVVVIALGAAMCCFVPSASGICPLCPACGCLARASIADISTPDWKPTCAGFPAIANCADPGWQYGGPEPFVYMDIGARTGTAPLILYAG